MRPTELAQDQTPHLDVLLHALHWVKNQEGTLPDYVMLLQPTSPLRIAEDIDAAVALALRTEGDAVISVTSADQHPYLSKLVDERGRLRDFIPRPDGYLRRQAIPPVYTLNGAIYLARCEILFERGTWYTEETYAYIMPRERSLDIDTPWDFHLVDLILRDRQNHGQKF
jgi:N-acylneuraminate cytidylyltransferase/CMP-N,N'-diacetyllegionaminic acid synthase